MTAKRLDRLLSTAAETRPNHTAIIDPALNKINYATLNKISRQISAQLELVGLCHNDRVGICAPKSTGAVASIFAVLASGGCYVPVDSTGPCQRSAFIFNDCSVKCVLVDRPLAANLQASLLELGVNNIEIVELAIEENIGIDLVMLVLEVTNEAPPDKDIDLAYILYTSGSTGKPKGVMHSHATAFSFIDWCSEEFLPNEYDRFSSHAPFHFDLSIFDLYVSIKHQATLVLIGETDGKQPLTLASTIAEQKISVWYSTPSILRMLVDYGKIDSLDYSALKLVLYAGEVFPIKHLDSLCKLLPNRRYYNLYGPTETNVCTFHPIPLPLPNDESLPQRIGKVCSADRGRVVNDNGQDVCRGDQGELWISGGSVHLGYWNLPEKNAMAFSTDSSGARWYKTGDEVIEQEDNSFLFLGRKDRMVKRRGFRVELGEIETVLYNHPNITEAAVVALPDEDSGVQLRAFIQWNGAQAPSIIQLKRFASENMLNYMIPDRFIILDALPKTSTDKIDYQRLKEL